ncbi:MAG: bleomycin resistance family protein [Rhizobiales bacterium]|nr:bleomycin resistance family protein [Hyphomicrobiales bacterium]MBG18664.1 bleomycin resistance family protein [Hyphomicrobiales bacterium]|tara:strand:+ start:4189 stop:4749 length:561 start_codon:yes stop_codon:yes gene_type:complete
MRSFLDAKAMARAMRETLSESGVSITRGQALEIVARQFGERDWNVLAAKIEAGAKGEKSSESTFVLGSAVPIIRIFDEAKAKDFYLDFLGCRIDWEHRFAPDMPLYCQVSRGDMVLHLSEHSGDATPGSNAVVFLVGLKAFHRDITDRGYRLNRPGIEEQDWGDEMTVTDPFSNRLRFIERRTADA